MAYLSGFILKASTTTLRAKSDNDAARRNGKVAQEK
jgi:hypothetical protein